MKTATATTLLTTFLLATGVLASTMSRAAGLRYCHYESGVDKKGRPRGSWKKVKCRRGDIVFITAYRDKPANSGEDFELQRAIATHCDYSRSIVVNKGYLSQAKVRRLYATCVYIGKRRKRIR